MEIKSSENRLKADDAMKNTVTNDDIVLVVQRFTKEKSIKIVKFDLEAYSADNLIGFLGSHRQLTIQFKRNNDATTETIKLFVKSIPYDCEDQATRAQDVGVFAEEYNFFNKIIPQLLENYVGEKFAPTCYLAKPDSFIMEDLRCSGYKLRENFYDCYLEVKSAMTTLARFHACTILAEAKLSLSAKKPTTIKEIYPENMNEKLFRKEITINKWLISGVNIICALGEKLGHDLQKLRQGIDRLFDLVKPSTVHRNVIIHSDLWTNNLMFDDEKPIPKCVLVDFQIIRYAPQALDVLLLLHLYTSREFRNSHEEELIKHYHYVIEDTIKKSNLEKVARSATLEELKAAIHDLRLFGVGMAAMYLPVMLIDPKLFKEKTKDFESYDNFLFGDKTQFTLDYMEQNEFFKNRVKNAVTELADVCDTHL